MRGTPGLVGLLLIGSLVALTAPVAGQIFIDSEERSIQVRPGDSASFDVTFTNPTDRPYFVAGSPAGNLSDETTITPNRFPLVANATTTSTVTVDAPKGTEFEQGDLFLQWTIVDRQTGEPLQQRTRVGMEILHPQLLFGLYENPLPAPLDEGVGMFAVELVGWLLIALFLVSVLNFVVHRLVPGAEEFVQDEMAAMLKAPVFYVIFVMGLNHSWRLIPALPTIEVIGAVLDAVAVVVAGVLAYRISGAGLYYYGQNIAGRTETKVDDVLVPVLEKLSAAVIIGLAAFYTFQILGVDLSFLVAGGLVVGLVISMAAQDTLSNFFSGIYLLIDRPFREGDDIQLDTGEICRVDHVGMRSCRLYHYRNHQQIIVPNNDLATKRVVNMSYPDAYYRIVIPVGVAYDTDLTVAQKLLHNVAMDMEEVLKGRNTGPRVFAKEFGESAIQLELRAYVQVARDRNPVGTKLIQAIKEAFDEAGIVIPFPQRVLWMHQADADGAGLDEVPPEAALDSGQEGEEGQDEDDEEAEAGGGDDDTAVETPSSAEPAA